MQLQRSSSVTPSDVRRSSFTDRTSRYILLTLALPLRQFAELALNTGAPRMKQTDSQPDLAGLAASVNELPRRQ
jgi:hypothetical protein